MRFKSDPVAATLLERPNRFLGVVDLEGAWTQCHIPDPGRLRELLYPGAEVYLVESPGGGRKTAYDMVLANHGGTLVSVDSRLPNQLLAEAIEAGSLYEFTGYRVTRTEPTFMDSRFDLLLAHGRSEMVLEAKSCTLVEGGVAMFPDAPTLRGARHMRTLVHALRDMEAAAVFVIQRPDARVFRPHREMDPGFCDALVAAASAGVQVYAYRCDVSLEGVRIAGRIPVSLE